LNIGLKSLAAISLILLLAAMAQGYSLWYDSLKARAVVKTGSTGGSITSYKALGVPDPLDPLCRASEGSLSLELDNTRAIVVFENVSQGWISWVGLVVSNDGSLPVNILAPNVTVGENFTYNAFLYGPFQAPGTSGVWGGVDPCNMYNNTLSYGDPFPSVGSVAQVELDPSQKAVIWILVVYEGVASLANTTITVELDKSG